MSTNFYLKPPSVDPIVDFQDIRIHIGKHSGGLVFVFQGHKNIAGHSVMSTKQWADFIDYATGIGWELINEYGAEISVNEFWERVTAAKNGRADHRTDSAVWNDDGNDFMDLDFS
jgi:hypothetical protein